MEPMMAGVFDPTVFPEHPAQAFHIHLSARTVRDSRPL
ncbi:hypothetical protein CGRA01v4_06065 [Colletotrichum graminicola]|nr:hypothetical protein CGRA01v4_06065 [Colletotrichum graminicola]